jgi:integrator complex subunit 1
LASAVLALTSDSSKSHSKSFRIAVKALGELFDGFDFAEFIIKSKKGVSASMSNAKNSARLIFECATLVGFSNPDSDGLNAKMLSLRKSLLEWCVVELGAIYYKRILREEESRCDDTYDGCGAVTRGPGEADFRSHLDRTSCEENEQRSSIYKYMSEVRCLLFLNPSTSRELQTFLDRELDKEVLECIDFCRRHGSNIDDSMLEIVLKSSREHITPSMAIALVESLLLGCSDAKDIGISSQVIWTLYELTEWKPATRAKIDNEMNLPRLAHSGLWWRVTSVALVLCSLSSDVGVTMWEKHPTLRALIKMTTAQKYRYPTADCDESQYAERKAADKELKEREAEFVELLFAAPKKSKSTDEPKPSSQGPPEYRRGLRSSARQREKKDRILAQEQKRIAAQLHAEQMKLRRQLKVLQKSVMIWDPVQYERKPPKESIELLLHVNETFRLAEKFRLSIQPDYLLQTVGAGRTAIERAYDWLIPIISMQPEIIHRLQPSSTCFLLLKAYGAEAGDNKELIGLSAPLLVHVKKCINMEYGQENSLLAMELLLTDIADESTDRRRCARKVLQQAIPNSFGLCGWMRQLLSAANAKTLVPLTTKFVVSIPPISS